MKNLFFKVSLLAMLGSLAGCVDETVTSKFPQTNVPSAESAFPHQSGSSHQAYLHGYPVNYLKINGEAVFQSDIILRLEELTDELTESTTTGRSRSTAKWPNKIIYYQIDPALPNQQRVYDAMAHWEANTAIRFVARTTQRGYVLFRNSSGCSANIGYSGGLQYVNIGNGCTTGNIIHEIGHTVGLWHEHSRADQNTHITIRYENVSPGAASNFYTYLGQGFDGFDYGGSMDFSSIMMYGPYDFSKNGQPTITRKE